MRILIVYYILHCYTILYSALKLVHCGSVLDSALVRVLAATQQPLTALKACLAIHDHSGVRAAGPGQRGPHAAVRAARRPARCGRTLLPARRAAGPHPQRRPRRRAGGRCSTLPHVPRETIFCPKQYITPCKRASCAAQLLLPAAKSHIRGPLRPCTHSSLERHLPPEVWSSLPHFGTRICAKYCLVPAARAAANSQGTPEEAVGHFCDLARESAAFFDGEEAAAPLPLEVGLVGC